MIRVAVIGLGTGTMAAFARPGDIMTFYEIDPLVRDIATNRFYFSYVPDAIDRGATVRIEMGDARIRMDEVRRERPSERYDLIVVDAFSSDAIPVHLLTREAFRLYFDMLNVRGLLVLHLSNRYLSLEPVVANLAEDARLDGRLLRHDLAPDAEGASRVHLGRARPAHPGRSAAWRRTRAGRRRSSSRARASACGPTTSTTCWRSSTGKRGPIDILESGESSRARSPATFPSSSPRSSNL